LFSVFLKEPQKKLATHVGMQERLSVRSYIMKTCTGDPMAAYRKLRPEPQISVNLLKLTSEKKKRIDMALCVGCSSRANQVQPAAAGAHSRRESSSTLMPDVPSWLTRNQQDKGTGSRQRGKSSSIGSNMFGCYATCLHQNNC